MNSKYIKTGILAILLVVPVFVFLFLDFFGKNHYDLPYLFPEINEYGEAVVENGDTVFHQIPTFSLIDQSGHTFDSKELNGNMVVVDFFFSRCGTICPTLTKNLSRVQKNFQNLNALQFVSITVDPKFDSAAVLKKYAEKSEVIESNWKFLTGSKEDIYELAIKGFKLPVADASQYDAKVTSVDEMFIHSEKVLLLDKKGYIRGVYDGTNKADIERLMVEIKVLVDAEKQTKN